MTIAAAITATYLRAVGKTTAPSTSKYAKIVGLLSFFQDQWSKENGVDWNSLYDPLFSLGTITATDSYDLDTSTIRKLSDREGDSVRIVWSDGVGYTDYDIVNADTLKDYYYGPNKESYSGFYCAQIGNQLVFNHTFTSNDSQFGGEIFVPIYTFTDEITSTDPNSDEVQVNDPNWLVVRAAAEYVRTDLTRQGQYGTLLAEANEIMQRMIEDNDSQISLLSTPWTPQSGLGADAAWS
jgi:hypothetical protein